MALSDSLVFAIPRGRILRDATPLLKSLGLLPAPGLLDESDRRLQFAPAADGANFVRARSFDPATFVAFGGAHFGLAGTDVLSAFLYPGVSPALHPRP